MTDVDRVDELFRRAAISPGSFGSVLRLVPWKEERRCSIQAWIRRLTDIDVSTFVSLICFDAAGRELLVRTAELAVVVVIGGAAGIVGGDID